jgi:M6 family metalloprotease-like protein
MSALNGEVIVAGQSIGDSIQLKIYGDEFYARRETLDGYTVVYDTQRGEYCYATLAAGRLVSSGIPLHKNKPSALRKHLKDSPKIRNEKFGLRYQQLRPPEKIGNPSVMRTLGAEGGLLEGRKLHHGNVQGLSVIVDFDDVRTNISHTDVDAMFNSDNYVQNGNFCSVKRYFEIVSSGKLSYTNLVVGPIRLSKRRSHYINNLLVNEAMDIVVNDLGIDLQQFDSKNEGVVDAINFLYAGESQYDGDLWPHNHFKQLNYGNMRTHYYQLTGLGQRSVDLRIGTICHENGHLLCRFPDMYDYGKRDGDFEKSQGIGRYCLMGSGNHLNDRRTPAPICGYLRELAGWVDEVIDLNSAGDFSAIQGQYDSILKYSTDKANEYFVIENRTRIDLDSHLPSSGLAILHCDTLGSNEWQQGTRNKHYQCALVQADGHLDLENNRNTGDDTDLFAGQSGIVISDETVPSSREWDDTDSGMQIRDVSEPGSVITFSLGIASIPSEIVVSSSPNLIIPDNNAAGIASHLSVNSAAEIQDLSISVQIIHSWISDLKVSLRSPSGTSVILHDRKGNDGDDIFETWNSSALASLAVFHGENVEGKWTLNVQDNASADVGRLLSWSLNIGVKPISLREIEIQAAPNSVIPDNNLQGISSIISQGKKGHLKEITAWVDIEHSYIGDLQVELVAPSGRLVLLHDKEGASKNNLKRDYGLLDTPSLQGLLQESIAGNWQLRVRDLASADVGVLQAWGVKINY